MGSPSLLAEISFLKEFRFSFLSAGIHRGSASMTANPFPVRLVQRKGERGRHDDARQFAAKSNATKPKVLAFRLCAGDLSSVRSKDPPIDRLCRLRIFIWLVHVPLLVTPFERRVCLLVIRRMNSNRALSICWRIKREIRNSTHRSLISRNMRLVNCCQRHRGPTSGLRLKKRRCCLPSHPSVEWHRNTTTSST